MQMHLTCHQQNLVIACLQTMFSSTVDMCALFAGFRSVAQSLHLLEMWISIGLWKAACLLVACIITESQRRFKILWESECKQEWDMYSPLASVLKLKLELELETYAYVHVCIDSYTCKCACATRAHSCFKEQWVAAALVAKSVAT